MRISLIYFRLITLMLVILSCSSPAKNKNSENNNLKTSSSPEQISKTNTNSSDKQNKYALLIGINDYEMVSNLKGCVNDIVLMKSLLINKYGFSQGNILTLINEEATRENIINSFFSHLIDQVKEDDIVVFHYSGHGAQIYNLDTKGKNEVDSLEEILVTYDFEDNPNNEFKGIVDDEINGLIKKLTNITKNVTFIFDACHSADITKSLARTRSIQAKPRVLPSPDSYAINHC